MAARAKWKLSLFAIVPLGIACHGCERFRSNNSENSAHTTSDLRIEQKSGTVTLSKNWIDAENIQLEMVQNRELGTHIVTSGRVTYNDMLVSHVVSPVSGRTTEIIGSLGQFVQKDSPLAVIASPDMGIASSDVDKAKADLNQATSDLYRQKDLLAAHAIPERDYENAWTNYADALSEYKRAQNKLALLGGNPNDTHNVSQKFTLKSPINGQIVDRRIFLGDEIQGQYGSGNAPDLFVIADLHEVWVMADIYESDFGRVHPKQSIEMTVEGVPDRIFTGTVDWVAEILDSTTRTAQVRCRVQNDDQTLKYNMFATVSITVPGHHAPAIPRSSLMSMGGKTVVFVQDSALTTDGSVTLTRRPIIVDDLPGQNMLAIIHGLHIGETIVTQGADKIAAMF